MEDYAAKMQLKTDAALREYVNGYAQYREAAVLAAFDELRRRGQPAPEEAAMRPALEAAAAAQHQAELAAEAALRQTEEAEEVEEAGPALYSPFAIIVFSVPFSMLAGGILLGLNLQRLRQWRALGALALFMVVYLSAGSLLFGQAVLNYGVSPLVGAFVFNTLAVLVYMFWFWPRYVGKGPFRSRSWMPPLLVSLVLFWALQKAAPYLMKQQPKEAQREMERLMPK